MSDKIVLIHSDHNGNPSPGSALGHWVLFRLGSAPVPVNQLTAGGLYPHSDCGEACVESVLRTRGVNDDPIKALEHEEGAGAQGTNASQLEKSLAEDHIASSTSRNFPPGSGWYVMNPVGGRVLPPGQHNDYPAAYWGQTIDIADGATPAPAPAPAPHPSPPPVNMYTVRKGDTLGGIAAHFRRSLAAVERANPQIKNPNSIYPGQRIRIP